MSRLRSKWDMSRCPRGIGLVGPRPRVWGYDTLWHVLVTLYRSAMLYAYLACDMLVYVICWYACLLEPSGPHPSHHVPCRSESGV